jgi:tetratricopeptide (TPR) repeat protein/ribosomal protein L40E
MSAAVCPSCGAKLPAGAERCDLCGAPTAAAPEPVDIAATPPAAAAPPPAPAGDHRFCVSCGKSNPGFARYCWNCGEALVADDAPPAAPPAGAATAAGPAPAGSPPGAGDAAGKHAILLVAGAAALVIVLFAITQLTDRSDRLTPPGEATAASGEAAPMGPPPLSDEARQRVEALEQQIEAEADDEQRRELRQQLVDTLWRESAFGRAGEVQEVIARELDTADAWADAGSFYLAQMLRIEGPDQSRYARDAARSFELALERRPGDLDIKTDLATAYIRHPDNPMRGVELVREVIDENPDHTRARYNYALMLAQIGRNDQARSELEQVIARTEPGEFIHDHAHAELERLNAILGT